MILIWTLVTTHILLVLALCTCITMSKWEYNFDMVISEVRELSRMKALNETRYREEHRDCIIDIIIYSSCYIASTSKLIYCKTQRRKIGNIASQLTTF